jgi:phospholipid/cholesterol/gamma-HCH transport system substrate-binding protein
MERSTAEKTKLGLFVITGTVLIVIASYLIGSKQNLFGNTFELKAEFTNVSGLQNGNNVRFSGINVGTVRTIDMVDDTTIVVGMSIQNNMLEHIRTNAIATIGSDGLVGSMLINIIPSDSDAPLVSTGDTLSSYSKIGTDDMLNTLSVTNENAALLTADLLMVTEALVSGRGTLGRLLNDTLMASDFSQMIENLSEATKSATITMRELERMVRDMRSEGSLAGVLLNDTEAAENLRNVLYNLEESSLAIDSLSHNLQETTEKLKSDEGAMAYLTSDSVFVDRLDSTMQNIQLGTARFNENMEALQHNFLFKRYFKKKRKGKL